ncbi:MAG: DNA gyrase inhibitor YacG [Rhizobacter sp.]|nr:DNA gyrase inhibitor YacG [Rhizobacter sp.]
MTTSAVGPRVVRCPGCGSSCVYSTENPYRPFCSARCKNNDFGAWASERFSVDAEAELPDVDVDVEPAPPRSKPN